jgi:CheY-like chemotaxis protein
MPKHIIVADDEEQIRLMLEQLLSSHGYKVTPVSNGNEAIATYEAESADLIITDLIMPGKEGIETIAELRDKSPDLKIIAISGGGRVGPENYLYLAEKLGAERTFSKPFDHRAILAAVEELVGK